MKLEDVLYSPDSRGLARQAPLTPHIDEFVETIGNYGFTSASLRDVVVGVVQFGVYLREHGIIDLQELRREHVEGFVATQPERTCRGTYRYRFSRGVRGARLLLRYARAARVVPAEPAAPPAPYAAVLDEWLGFLERHRGLAPKSLALYRRHIERFLKDLAPGSIMSELQGLDAKRVHTYVRSATRGRSRSERKGVTSTLRIFLRFAWNRGYVSQDLANAVGRVPSFKEERLPRGPRWDDALRLLETPDRAAALGRRDYAILQVLLSYGVRAQHICRLRLEDLDWQRSTIHFAALKSGRAVDMPMLNAVGEAIVDYLRFARPCAKHREVFLSTRPPFSSLTTSAITGLVSRAFCRAGVPSPHRGSHALRHAWATHLLAEGASIKTIAELLGHRSIETTRIYAKVDSQRLRTVGLPWPQETAQ